MPEAGVVRHEGVQRGGEGGKGVLPQQEDEGDRGRNQAAKKAGCEQAAPARPLVLGRAKHVGRQRELRNGEQRSGRLDGEGYPGEQSEGRGADDGALAKGIDEKGSRGDQADGHGEVTLSALGDAVAPVDEDEEGCGEERGQPGVVCDSGAARCSSDDGKEGEPCDREQKEVEEAQAERAAAEDVHGGELDQVGAGHVHVAELPVGRPAAFDEENDVVHERGIAHQRPMPRP